ncbi:AAA family ATPase [Burkholderia pseudomallei]|uniref:AAA family ATPase n=1 Tax=Burkholderia pseudomallei TaxID=28450 RepID=UPI001FB6BD8A|nr:AAA family ATPase [Burkholderia pseudomallei]
MNVIYGRNYSGKTTLSRIIRSLETGSISPRYTSPSFSITISGATVTNNNIPAQGHEIRVYNKDFVDKKIFDKANKNPTGIKHNSLYKDANYDVRYPRTT